MTAPEVYDELLRERATVECAGGECCRECVDGRLVAKAGCTVELPCRRCQPGDSECDRCGVWRDTEYGRLRIPEGKVLVLLGKDPERTYTMLTSMWRHIGTVVR